MTPLARQEAEAGSTGWGGLSSSDSSRPDSQEGLGRAWEEVLAPRQARLVLCGPGWA